MKMIFKKIAAAAVVGTALLAAQSAFADFIDMPTDNPAMKEALENAVANGLLTGTSDTTIEPYTAITRAEMGTIIVRCFGATETTDMSEFTDVPAGQWYYDYMSKAVAMGAFAGSGDGKLNPEVNITKQEAFTVMSRIFDIQDYDVADLSAYTDRSSIEAWADEYVAKIVSNGYWAAGGELNPTVAMTRGEFAILMDNMVETYISEPGTYENIPEGNVVVRSADVTIKNMVNTGDVLIGDAIAGGMVTLEGCDLYRLIVRSGNINLPQSKLKFGRMEKSGVKLYCGDLLDKSNTTVWGVAGTVVDSGVVGI